MNKQLLSIIFGLLYLLPLSIIGQKIVHFSHGCNFASDKTEGDYPLFESTEQAEKTVDEILDIAILKNTKRPFILKVTNVENAQATSLGDDLYILYSHNFMKKFSADAKTKWVAYTIFAHEIAHHILRHNLSEKDLAKRKVFELEADMWATRVLVRLKASRDDALAAIRQLSLNIKSSESDNYPPISAREEAIGYTYDEEKKSFKPSAAQIDKTEIKLAANDNRWSLVQSKDISAIIDNEKVVIHIKNIPEYYKKEKLYIKLESLDKSLKVAAVNGTGDSLAFSPTKQVIWNYLMDDMPKLQASGSEKIKISIYSTNNLPRRIPSFVKISMGAITATGCIALGYSFAERQKALDNYQTYKTKLDENDAIYKTESRENLYSKANSDYKTSQVIMIGGSLIAILGGYLMSQKIKMDKEAKQAGFFLTEARKLYYWEPFAPVTERYAGVGVRLRF